MSDLEKVQIKYIFGKKIYDNIWKYERYAFLWVFEEMKNPSLALEGWGKFIENVHIIYKRI